MVKKYRYKWIYRKHHPNADQFGRVYEHRYIIELQLGRYLNKDEIVHHIDKDETNNDLSNLRLCNNYKEHKKQHYGDIDNRICLICGSNKTFIDKNRYNNPNWYKYKDGFICMSCYNKTKKLNRKSLKHKMQMDLLKQFLTK